ETLAGRAARELWTPEMSAEARRGAADFSSEQERLERGIQILRDRGDVRQAFQLMNRAMIVASQGKNYDRWRPFQLGFLLASLACLVDDAEADIADIVWFATGGGKTETYLGMALTAAFYDRIRGKQSGITAWSRFPLRMLSLQQTQRFADAFAAAELVRRES